MSLPVGYGALVFSALPPSTPASGQEADLTKLNNPSIIAIKSTQSSSRPIVNDSNHRNSSISRNISNSEETFLYLNHQQHDSSSPMNCYNQLKRQTDGQQQQYNSSTASYYICCACCRQRQPCKCLNLTDMKVYNERCLSETFDFELEGNASTAGLIEYPQQHQSSSPSLSLPVTSSEAIMTNLDQGYDQDDYRINGSLTNHQHHNQLYNQQLLHHDHQQQEKSSQQQPQSQDQFHHRHNHNNHDNQYHHNQQQQVSCQSDNQLVISGNSSDNQLTYNYDEHDDGGADNWTMTLNSRIPSNSIFGETQFKLNINAEPMAKDQRSGLNNQQTYTQLPGSNILHNKMLLNDLNDCNNNQHNSTFSASTSNRIVDRDSFCHQLPTDNQQNQAFSRTNFYLSSVCNDSLTYQQRLYHPDTYEPNQNKHNMPSIQETCHIQNIQSVGQIGIQTSQPLSPTSNLMQPQHGSLPGYERQSPQPQSDHHQCHHRNYNDHSSLKLSLHNNQQFHNNPSKLQSQVYQPASDQQTTEYKLPEDCAQHQQTSSHCHIDDNQYVLKTVGGYNNLQQQSMNLDTYTNQVPTATVLAEALEQSASKSKKNRRGRPRKKGLRSKSKVNGKLWEFIRDLLLNDRTNPSFIRWERREDGVFKFVQSDKVAKMWGERKQNPKMTYEKLSRAMRYYYKSKVLLPVFGRRLVYKFGPNATGWLPEVSDTF